MVTASEMGKKGGGAKSEAKTAAARKNASKPRGKWVTFFYFGALGADNKMHDGCCHFLSRFDLDLTRNGDQINDWITEELIDSAPASALPWSELVTFGGRQVKVS